MATPIRIRTLVRAGTRKRAGRSGKERDYIKMLKNRGMKTRVKARLTPGENKASAKGLG